MGRSCAHSASRGSAPSGWSKLRSSTRTSSRVGELEVEGARGRAHRPRVGHDDDPLRMARPLRAHEVDRVAHAVARGPARHVLEAVELDQRRARAGPRAGAQSARAAGRSASTSPAAVSTRAARDGRRSSAAASPSAPTGGQGREGRGEEHEVAREPDVADAGEGEDGHDDEERHEGDRSRAQHRRAHEREEGQRDEDGRPVGPQPRRAERQVLRPGGRGGSHRSWRRRRGRWR